MTRRSRSSGRWLDEHHSDPYVRRAREAGLRSRAAYKLEQIDAAEKLIFPGAVIVDLGAAPGGWSQFAVRALQGRGEVFALDVLPMPGITGVTFLQGDFREEEVLRRLDAALGGRKVDLVLSDMAPNMSGIDSVDQPRAMYLAELALDMAQQVLAPGGAFVAKMFHGEGFDEVYQVVKASFLKVLTRKPRASRPRSREVYVVAKGFRGA